MGYIMGFWYCVFFFKQKTAYELRISDWSSDVCSSDLDMVLDIGVEIFAADALDDIARERGRISGIGRRRAGREDAFGQRERHLLLERHHRLRIAADQVAYRFLETRGMRHDVAHRDRLALIGRNLEIEIGVDVLVEVDLARLDLLHHRGPVEQLRHRTGAEQRGCGRAVERRGGKEG